MNQIRPSTLHTEIRAAMAYSWLIRTYAPVWLDAAGLHSEAQTLRKQTLSVGAAQTIHAAALMDATTAVLTSDLRGAGVVVETSAQQAIDASPVTQAVAAVWADPSQRDSIGWDVWHHLVDAVQAAATAVAVRAASANPTDPEQAAAAALAQVVAKLNHSAEPLATLLTGQAVRP